MAACVGQETASAWALELRRALRPPCAVVGIGNRLRGDDAVGPQIAARLHGRCGLLCYDGGTAPENLAGPLRRLEPGSVLLVDAARFGAEPGRIRLFAADELADVSISTHTMSPALLMDYLADGTGADVWLLGIQATQCDLGDNMYPACRNAVTTVVQALLEISAQVE